MDMPAPPPNHSISVKPRPFRRAVLRGMALVLPPVLTVVTLLWVAGTVEVYVLRPVTVGAREVLIWCTSDIRDFPSDKPEVQSGGRTYERLESNEYVPRYVVADMAVLPPNARVAYEQYVTAHYLQPVVVVPLFLVVFVAVLYVLGKLFTARVGSIFEPLVRRLPLVRGVYASVKKVTDFALVDSGEVRYLRVVAIEFPRPGIWTVGLVTGEGMTDIAGAAGEPCLTVAVPGSPVPFTGNVVTVRKSEAHDLSISIDEALQFFISCGVVVPRRELPSKDAAKYLPMTALTGPTASPTPLTDAPSAGSTES